MKISIICIYPQNCSYIFWTLPYCIDWDWWRWSVEVWRAGDIRGGERRIVEGSLVVIYFGIYDWWFIWVWWRRIQTWSGIFIFRIIFCQVEHLLMRIIQRRDQGGRCDLIVASTSAGPRGCGQLLIAILWRKLLLIWEIIWRRSENWDHGGRGSIGFWWAGKCLGLIRFISDLVIVGDRGWSRGSGLFTNFKLVEYRKTEIFIIEKNYLDI